MEARSASNRLVPPAREVDPAFVSEVISDSRRTSRWDCGEWLSLAGKRPRDLVEDSAPRKAAEPESAREAAARRETERRTERAQRRSAELDARLGPPAAAEAREEAMPSCCGAQFLACIAGTHGAAHPLTPATMD